MTLSGMVPGDTGSVRDLSATGALGQRLMDLGFYPGARVRVVQQRPSGGPRGNRTGRLPRQPAP